MRNSSERERFLRPLSLSTTTERQVGLSLSTFLTFNIISFIYLMEVGIHRYLDFSLFLSHLKYKGLQSRERENAGTSKQLFALQIIQRAIVI